MGVEFSGKYLCLAVPRGVEPPTFGLGNRCSILLSYGTVASPSTTGSAAAHRFQILVDFCARCRDNALPQRPFLGGICERRFGGAGQHARSAHHKSLLDFVV